MPIKVAFLIDKNHSTILISQLSRYHPDIKGVFVTPQTMYRLLRANVIHIVFPILTKNQVRGLQVLKWMGKKIILHWIGHDVMRMFTDSAYRDTMLAASKISNANITQSQELKDELKSFGIESEIIRIITSEINYQEVPLPKEFTVLTYLPEKEISFYGYETVIRLARDFPKIKFVISSNSGRGLEKPKNLTYLGKVASADELLNNVSCLLRPVKHDGLSKMVLEALGKGRHVIWTYDFPYCHPAKSYEEIKTTLEKISQRNTINAGASEFIKKNFKIKDNIALLAKLYHRIVPKEL